jgi:hypothetical protein
MSRVSGSVRELDGTPVPNALVAVEKGNLFSGNPDPSMPNPAYTWGAVADSHGVFVFECPCGSTIGVHALAAGHKQNDPGLAITISADTDIGPIALPKVVAPAALPSVMDLTASPPTTSPGGMVTFTLSAAAPPAVATGDGGAKRDWLSDEIVCIEPHTYWGRAMAPPGPPMNTIQYQDGTWTRTIMAPAQTGVYRYYFVAATVSGVSSNVVTTSLTVQ